MTKNPKRVAAGKRAWNKLSASVKASRIARLKSRSKGSTSQSRGQNMANKGNGNGKRQGLVSWLTSVISTLIALTPVIQAGVWASKVGPGDKWDAFSTMLIESYTGYNMITKVFNAKAMINGYGPLAAAIVFKKATSYLVKIAPVKSLIPRIG